jgi:hypothetical protein
MSNVSLNRLKKRVNNLIEEQGADSTPLDILVGFVNCEISYWDALHILGQMKFRISEIQSILIKELHPHIKEHNENSYYIKEILKQKR